MDLRNIIVRNVERNGAVSLAWIVLDASSSDIGSLGDIALSCSCIDSEVMHRSIGDDDISHGPSPIVRTTEAANAGG